MVDGASSNAKTDFTIRYHCDSHTTLLLNRVCSSAIDEQFEPPISAFRMGSIVEGQLRSMLRRTASRGFKSARLVGWETRPTSFSTQNTACDSFVLMVLIGSILRLSFLPRDILRDSALPHIDWKWGRVQTVCLFILESKEHWFHPGFQQG